MSRTGPLPALRLVLMSYPPGREDDVRSAVESPGLPASEQLVSCEPTPVVGVCGYPSQRRFLADELGALVHPNNLSSMFVVRRRAAGVPVGSIHVLRHTAATLALAARVPLHVVAARLGDRPETLLATYPHLLPSSDAAAADAVAAAAILVDSPLKTSLLSRAKPRKHWG
jgi:hypothetical protein